MHIYFSFEILNYMVLFILSRNGTTVKTNNNKNNNSYHAVHFNDKIRRFPIIQAPDITNTLIRSSV